MQHYKFHIGDYATCTQHLSDEEDLAYRRMLDLYYRTEKPLDRDPVLISRLVRMPEQVVRSVLMEFFCEDSIGWFNGRCEEEIAAFKEISEQKSRAGKASAAARSNTRPTPVQQACNDSLATGVQQPTTHYPLPTTHKEKSGAQAPRPRFARPALEEVKAYCVERKNTIDPQQFIDFYESKGWTIGKNPMRDWRAAVRTWEKRNASSTSQPSQYNPRGGPAVGPNAPRPCICCGSTTRGGSYAPDGFRCFDHPYEE